MKRKMLPLTLMLIAGAIVCIVCSIQRYDMKTMLLILLAALAVFYVIGWGIKRLLDHFEKENKEKEKQEKNDGEVIEKEAPAEDTTEKDSTEN